MTLLRALCLGLPLIALAACSGSDGGASNPPVTQALCSSGTMRDPNESESAEMMPGRACNACHADSNAATGDAAPIFAFAGTVFPTAHEPDDCVASGAEGAQVIVTDANGKDWSVSANHSGNFFVDTGGFAFPFTARVVFEGRERRMVGAQARSDCNSCHTVNGTEGAPGRIMLP